MSDPIIDQNELLVLIDHFKEHEKSSEQFRQKVNELNGSIPELRKELKTIMEVSLPNIQRVASVIETRTETYNSIVEKTHINTTEIKNIWSRLKDIGSGQTRIFLTVIVAVILTILKFFLK